MFRKPNHASWLLPVLGSALALVLACRSEAPTSDDRALQRLLAVAPGLDADLAQQVVDDRTDLEWYADEHGARPFVIALRTLYDALRSGDAVEWQNKRQFLLPHIRKISEVLVRRYCQGGYWEQSENLATLSYDEYRRVVALDDMREATWANSTLSSEDQLDILEFVCNGLENLGPRRAYIAALSQRYSVMFEWGMPPEQWLPLVQKALEVSREIDDAPAICKHIGFLAHYYQSIGQLDLAKSHVENALDRALDCQLPYQAPRLARFYASIYQDEGRHGLALEFADWGLQLARDFKSRDYEIDAVCRALFTYESYGCYEMLGRLVSRGELLLLEHGGEQDMTTESGEIKKYKARYMLSRGRVAEATALFEEAEALLRDGPQVHVYLNLLALWTKSYVEHGLIDEAWPWIEKGLQISLETSNNELTPEFLHLKARAELKRGDTRSMRSALIEFHNYLIATPSTDWEYHYLHDLLQARFHRHLGSEDGVKQHTARAWNRLHEELSRNDASLASYQYFKRAFELREFMHEELARDAIRGYQFELGWAGLWRRLGGVDRSPELVGSQNTVPTSLSRTGARADSLMQDWLAQHDGLHVLYQVTPNYIQRWVRDRDSVTIEKLPDDPARLLTLVEQVMNALTRDPGDLDAPLDGALRDALSDLSARLLPLGRLQARDEIRPLLITPDGFLRGLPFAALDADPGANYEPLLARFDVAAMRSVDKVLRSPAMPGVVLANAQLSPEHTRRYPELRNLYEGVLEAQVVRKVHPDATLLVGRDASKSQLLSYWNQARFIYFATHMVRDPENPYNAFIPLSSSRRDFFPEEARIEVRDIRNASLSQCELVVLSACQTGRPPNLRDGDPAPSLAEAFVDSGAHAVVHTLWKVRDKTASDLMGRFLVLWGQEKKDPMCAISQACRALMKGDKGIRHPFSWAAYGIHLGGLVGGEPDS